jgi:hypothetical protein
LRLILFPLSSRRIEMAKKNASKSKKASTKKSAVKPKEAARPPRTPAAIPLAGDLLALNPDSIGEGGILALKPEVELAEALEKRVQKLRKGICRTDYRPRESSLAGIVVDATEGFIPLWERNQVLLYRFDAASLAVFLHADDIKAKVTGLLNSAIAAWGDAAPIRFKEHADNSDFEIVIERFDDCTTQGCVLAEAFFPDAGRHRLRIFPQMFQQEEKEQIETLVHEIGHVFGLRHFFATQFESDYPSEIFGENEEKSIMNYGELSQLTEVDKRDLKLLYEGVWSGTLTQINRTPIKLVRPFHYQDA